MNTTITSLLPSRCIRTALIAALLALSSSSPALFALAGLAASLPAHATGVPTATAMDARAVWQSECGGCHIAYTPGLLPRRSWQALMGSLDRHFGTDASLDPATSATILAYLETQSRDTASRTADAAPLRITELAWFRREHRRAAEGTRSGPARSLSDCTACHRGAAAGVFEEEDEDEGARSEGRHGHHWENHE